MDLGIDGKVALVTAASKGLGFASASALAAEGCHVVITGRDAGRIEAAAASLPGGAFGLVADMSAPGAPAGAVERTAERFGRLDIVVANAGGPPPARALEVERLARHAEAELDLRAHRHPLHEAAEGLGEEGVALVAAVEAHPEPEQARRDADPDRLLRGAHRRPARAAA